MNKIFFIIITMVTVMGISAQSREHAFSLGTSIGLLNGQVEEIVYRGKNSNNKLSQLLWNMNPLVYAGTDVHYNWQKPSNTWSIFADTAFKFGFPGKTGIMEDRDWTNASYADFLTHYSVSDNKTESAMLIDINAGAAFTIFKKFLIKPFISYNYMSFSFTANGGSLLYPGGHNYLNSIDVASYKQTWNIIGVGASFYGKFNRYFDIDISLKLSPLIWCKTEDNHIIRIPNLIVTESLDGGFFIEPKLLFSYTPNDFFTLSLSVAYTNISGSRGDSEYKENGQISIYKNIGGAGYSTFDIGIFAKFKILKL